MKFTAKVTKPNGETVERKLSTIMECEQLQCQLAGWGLYRKVEKQEAIKRGFVLEITKNK